MIANSTQRPDAWRDLIPKHWKSDRLSKFADIIVSNVDKKTEDGEDLVLLCNYVDVYKNDRITADIPFMEASATPHEIVKFTLQRDDVITTKDSENPLDIAIPSLVAEDFEDVLCGYHLAILRSEKRHLFGPYLSWLHVSQTIRAHYEMHATGITRWAIGRKHFKTCPIPLPPLPEQKRIAAYLDASCAAIDRAVETKQKQLETLDAIRKSIIQRAVIQGLNPKVKMKDSGVEILAEIPAKWQIKRLKSLSTIRYGLGQPPERKDDGLPILRATNVKRGKISEIGLIHVDPDDLPNGRDPYLKTGEIIVVRSGAYTADSAIIPEKWNGAIAGYDMVVTPRFNEPRFLAYALLSDYVLKDQLLLMTLRAAQPHLNANELGSVSIAVPPSLEIQRGICDYIDKKLQDLESVQQCITSQIATLTAYRKSLIHECVTGKQRISDSDVAKVEAHV